MFIPKSIEDCEDCPFCGNRPNIVTTRGDERNGYADTVTIKCSKCGASISRTDIMPDKPPYYAKPLTGMSAAIDAWNTHTSAKQEPVGYMNLYLDGRFSAAYESKEEAVKRRFDGHYTIPVYDHPTPAKYDEAKVDELVEAARNIADIMGANRGIMRDDYTRLTAALAALEPAPTTGNTKGRK